MEEPVRHSSVPGRRCLNEGCATVLSSYNVGVLCWTHADEKARTRFDRRTASKFAQRLESASWTEDGHLALLRPEAPPRRRA
jgi:hypothetical protein